MERLELIHRSIRCFAMGLLGLIPVLGIPVAFLARHEFHVVRQRSGQEWNPAEKYLLLGGAFAYIALGLMVAALAGVILIVGVNLTFL